MGQKSLQGTGLRRRAEAALRGRAADLRQYLSEDTAQLIHELQVHQIELEMQNEELRQTQKALEEARDRYASLYHNSPLGRCALAEEMVIVDPNRTLASLLGVDRRALSGKPLSRFIAREDQDTLYLHYRQVTATGARQSCECEMVRRDGTSFSAQLDSLLVPDPEGAGYQYQIAIEDITARKQAEKKALRYQQQLRSLAARLAASEEQERRKLALELHDRIGQVLAVAQMKVGALGASSAEGERAALLEEVSSLLEQADEEVRSLTFELSLPLLRELGLRAGLEWLVEKFRTQHGLQVTLWARGKPMAVGEGVEGMVFRGVRELLTNVVRHAQASAAHVDLQWTPKELTVKVADDGKGFDPSRLGGEEESQRFGLFSIREQLEAAGGHLQIDSAPGRGTRVALEVPFPRGASRRKMP